MFGYLIPVPLGGI